MALLCGLYVLAFVPANRTGAANVNMLEAFQLDEFGQFRALWRMTSPRESTAESLHGFFAYGYYYYGFPFFAVSAAVFWPLRWIYTSTREPGLTAASALALRELSPLFTALAIAILVMLWTRLRSTPRVIALFAFLASMPAVVSDNLWWHPDALLLFWVVVVIAALALDRLRLGRWFYLAAVACGLATATKIAGLWFFAAVLVHLIRARRIHPLPRLAAAAGAFLVSMSIVIAAASPQLFLPDQWDQIRAAISTWRAGIEVGWGTKGSTGPAVWYPALRAGFGWASTWAALLLLAGVTALRARRAQQRNLAITILAWTIPLSCYLALHAALQAERYLLPVLVPLASCAGSPVLWDAVRETSAPRLWRAAGALALVLFCAQLGVNTHEAVTRYGEVLHREQTSPSLAFWRRLDAEVISRLPPEAPVRILKSLYIYVPPEPRFESHIRWRSLDYADLKASNPDLILLRRSQIRQFADPDAPETSTDPAQARLSRRLYRDAQDDAIPGYRRLLATDFAVAFGRFSGPDPGPAATARAPD